jgi:hypothetical protein
MHPLRAKDRRRLVAPGLDALRRLQMDEPRVVPHDPSSELEVVGRVAGIDEAAFDRAAQEAEQACPVSRAPAGSVEIRLYSRLEAPSEPVGTGSRPD